MNLYVAIANTHHHHHHRRHLLNMPLSYKYNNNTQDSWVKNESNFDTNMVIILAALLSVLICALLLNSIVRCAMRCSTSFSTNETSVRLAATGLKKHELMKIPVAVYGSGENITVTECPICLGEFENGDKVRMLPKCNHGFHEMCIDTWLVTHSSCPNCRHSLFSVEKSSTRVCCVDGNNDTRAAGDRLPEGNLVVVVE